MLFICAGRRRDGPHVRSVDHVHGLLRHARHDLHVRVGGVVRLVSNMMRACVVRAARGSVVHVRLGVSVLVSCAFRPAPVCT